MINNELLDKIYPLKKNEIVRFVDSMPVPIKPVVTQQDGTAGYITRYFIKSVNDKNLVVEVDKKQFDTFGKNPRFSVTSLNWTIVGKKETITLNNGANIYGVADTNRITTSEVDLTFGGLRMYITSYLEHWVAEV
jgi:hypothetical protein